MKSFHQPAEGFLVLEILTAKAAAYCKIMGTSMIITFGFTEKHRVNHRNPQSYQARPQ